MSHHTPVRHTAAYGLVALSAAVIAYKYFDVSAPTASEQTLQTAAVAQVFNAAVEASASVASAPAMARAEAGILWDREAGANPVREIQANAFAASQHWTAGQNVSLALAPGVAPLAATVTYTGTNQAGVRTSHLEIAGDPAGHLMLLEDPAQNFFVGQLTYPGHSLAYEFRKSGNSLIGTRKELSDLICASDDGQQVGLPEVSPEAAPAVPSITVAPASSLEGKANGFVVSLSTPTTATVKVTYQLLPGSADTADYRSKTGILTIRPKATSAKLSISGVQDKVAEADEQFTLVLSDPVNATLAEESAVATIVDNDGPASVRVFPTQISEGTSSQRDMVFTVWLGKAADTTVTLDYATVDGTAQAGSDYTPVAGTLTLKRGKTSATIKVPILNDAAEEENESFTLQLSNVVGVEAAITQAVGTIVNDDVLQVASPSPVPKFTSKPSAAGVVFLDFDGHTCSGTSWKDGGTIEAAAVYDTLGEAGVKEIWDRFVEAYAPFNLNVTTDENYFLNAAPGKRIRCVVTPSNEWYTKTDGGVAYVGSFQWTNESPVWVFSDNLSNSPKFIAIAGMHEVGHALGLSHDGSSKDGAYYQGHGSGEISWAPIMGYGLYKNVVQWSRGEYYGANQKQDDTAIIAANPGVGYVTDEDSNSSATARPLGKSVEGVISSTNDVDVFSFTTQGGNVSIQAFGSGVSSKLDIQLEVRDDSGQVVASANPSDALDATISANLPAGNYTLHLSGSGTGTPAVNPPTGYTKYGSLGQYLLTSSIP